MQLWTIIASLVLWSAQSHCSWFVGSYTAQLVETHSNTVYLLHVDATNEHRVIRDNFEYYFNNPKYGCFNYGRDHFSNGSIKAKPYEFLPAECLSEFDFSGKGWLSTATVEVENNSTIFKGNCKSGDTKKGIVLQQPDMCTDFSRVDGAAINLDGYTKTLRVDSRGIPQSLTLKETDGNMEIQYNFTYFAVGASNSSDPLMKAVPKVCIGTPFCTNGSPGGQPLAVYRQHRSESPLSGVNVANAGGMMEWLCDFGNDGPYVSKYELTVNANYTKYSPCSSRYCGPFETVEEFFAIGIESWDQSNDCDANGSFWYSLSKGSKCPPGKPVSYNKCSWAYVNAGGGPVKNVKTDCLKGDDETFAQACAVNTNNATYIEQNFEKCPHVDINAGLHQERGKSSYNIGSNY